MTDPSETWVRAGHLVAKRGIRRGTKDQDPATGTNTLEERRDKGNFPLTGSTVSRINSAYIGEASVCET